MECHPARALAGACQTINKNKEVRTRPNVEGNAKIALQKTYQLSKRKDEERQTLFRDKTVSEIKLVVYRPTRPVFQEGKVLLKTIKTADDTARRAVESVDTL